MNKPLQTIILTAVIAGIVGALTATLIIQMHHGEETSDTDEMSAQERIAEYYASETTVLVSPHHVRKAIMNGEGDFILVDVRSPEEYEAEHIIGAVSVPVYLDKENTQKSDEDRIIESFKKIEVENPDKDVIVYCYSHACMTGRKIGDMLARNGVYVRELGVGWNEWRHFWKQWNYPHEWENIDPLDYVATGTEPGEFVYDKDTPLPSPCDIDNEFGC